MMRTPTYKYSRYDDGGEELYDLRRDPNELQNQSDSLEYASIAAKLKQQLEEWELKYPHRV